MKNKKKSKKQKTSDTGFIVASVLAGIGTLFLALVLTIGPMMVLKA